MDQAPLRVARFQSRGLLIEGHQFCSIVYSSDVVAWTVTDPLKPMVIGST
jgi:hypothetical protein